MSTRDQEKKEKPITSMAETTRIFPAKRKEEKGANKRDLI
jgi:hypothetical protein